MVNCKTILIVDDEPGIRDVLSFALEIEGYIVRTAVNGKDASALLEVIERPALIILDIMMPIMGGHQFLEIIGKEATLRTIPIIVTSATALAVEVQGAKAFLKKPFNFDSFIEVVNEHCR